jgi:uncharacterized membrane protein YbhN (UPF0104 family)
MMQSSNFRGSKLIRPVIIILLAVGVYGLIPQVINVNYNWQSIRSANLLYVLLALGATLLTFGLAAEIYRSLSVRHLRFKETVLVQMAATFVNRLAPAGTGALGVNAAYLYKQKHTIYQSTAIVTLNNLCGLTGHFILLLIALLVLKPNLSLTFPVSRGFLLVVLVSVLILGILLLLAFPKSRSKVGNFFQHFFKAVASYIHRPSSLLRALFFSILLTISNVLALWFCSYAIGHPISVSTALIALTVGVAAASAIPTPGGLGSAEAGLYLALVQQNMPKAEALACVLMFRLINYWLPLVIGGVAFIFSQRRRLFI